MQPLVSLVFHLFFIICHPYIPLHLEYLYLYTIVHSKAILPADGKCSSVCIHLASDRVPTSQVVMVDSVEDSRTFIHFPDE